MSKDIIGRRFKLAHLHFNGNARDAVAWYQEALGAELQGEIVPSPERPKKLDVSSVPDEGVVVYRVEARQVANEVAEVRADPEVVDLADVDRDPHTLRVSSRWRTLPFENAFGGVKISDLPMPIKLTSQGLYPESRPLSRS